ncbi:MAG: fixJ [Alphaproteobacteria bacterium]|nr:fixJ [Alphaproteobacteria bacterium]
MNMCYDMVCRGEDWRRYMPGSNLIVVVDDDESVRLSTALLLEQTGHPVLTFASGDELLATQLPSQVGCVLLDMRMPGSNGLETMRALRQRRSSLNVVVLTGHGDIELAVEAMKLGAADFLQKPYSPERLVEAVTNCSRKSSSAADREMVAREARQKVALLSERQRAVLRGILRGKQSKIIAHELELSPRTVETYRAQLLSKLGVRATADAVRIALAAGLDDS